MWKISIDIETYCDLPLKTSGVYRYASDSSFEILLFAYSLDSSPAVHLIDLTADPLPQDIQDALVNPKIQKWAFNATFERVCLSNFLGVEIPPESWYCSMIWGMTLGLPLSLGAMGEVLGVKKQKLDTGKALIGFFCKPCKATKSNGGITRHYSFNNSEKWEEFKAYNIRDVEAEKEIQERLRDFPVSAEIWEEYWIDQRINDRGIEIDREFVVKTIEIHEKSKEKSVSLMQKLTELDNPNSVKQLTEWLDKQGLKMESLNKKAVTEALKTANPLITEVLQLRQKLSKSSVSKYTAMSNCVCVDNRVRGMFQFYGANRTGRWAGRLVQLQNLTQNHISDLAEARELVKTGDFEMVEMIYENIPSTLSELVRTAFVPKKGSTFLVADFSAIEARVIAWLGGEQWRMDVFAQGGDIYCASASQMFHVPVVKGGVNSHLRQKGKQAELACGYGGSRGALIAMGALELGMKEEELQPLVDSWRQANPKITGLWRAVEKSAKTCIREKRETETHGLIFIYDSLPKSETDFMFIVLPSGRKLAYVNPKLGENRFGGESVTYEGTSTGKKWTVLETFGGKLTENIVQAIARDLLMYAIKKLSHCRIVAHVHDEIIVESEENVTLEMLCKKMGEPPEWAGGLILGAEGYECAFYKKE